MRSFHYPPWRTVVILILFPCLLFLISCATESPTIEVSRLTASDSAAGDMFGHSEAISGEYLIVGMMGDDDGGANSGSAYVFHRTGNAWTEVAKLTAGDAATGDSFGSSVAISEEYAVIGARGDDDGLDSGSAYLFRRSGDTWTETAILAASDAAAGVSFGYSVATSKEDAIVGAPFGYEGGNPAGSAYVFPP